MRCCTNRNSGCKKTIFCFPANSCSGISGNGADTLKLSFYYKTQSCKEHRRTGGFAEYSFFSHWLPDKSRKITEHIRTVKKSKITANTIHKYLAYFEESFLIESAQRYDIKGKAYIGTPKKYYFSDIGLRNARIKFRQLEQTHSMENVIYNELRMRGYSVDVGVVPVTEKETNGKVARKQLEVDFACNLGSARYYIHSARFLPDEAKRTQEIRPLRKIDDS